MGSCGAKATRHRRKRRLQMSTAPHDRILRLPGMPSALTSRGTSSTTDAQKFRRTAMSFPRRNHLYSINDKYHQATGISLQAHPLICSRCCCKTSLYHQLTPPVRALPSKAPPSNGVTPLRPLASWDGLLAGHFLMPSRRLRSLPGMRRSFSEEEPDGDVWL